MMPAVAPAMRRDVEREEWAATEYSATIAP